MSQSPQKQPKILVVDDQEIIRFTIGEILTNQGYRTLEARDVPQGVQILGSQRPDLVLLDLTMPGADGMSLLRQMRQSPTFRKTPVIILTGHSDRDFVMEALTLGVKDYVVKPSMVVDDLLGRIRCRLEEAGISPPIPSGSIAATAKQGPELDLGKFLASLDNCHGGSTFAALKQQLLSTSSGSTTSVAEISEQIRNDPVLAYKILSLSHLGAPERSLEIEDAVQILGIEMLHSALRSTRVYEKNEDCDLLEDVIALYKRSIFCSRLLDRSTAEGNPGGLCGLLLDLPILLLLGWIQPTQWKAIRDETRNCGASIASVLEERFGIPYPEFVSATLTSAKLPELLRNTIKEYATAYFGEIPTSIPKSAALLDMAKQWANVLIAPERGLDPLQIHSKDELANTSFGIPLQELLQIAEQAEMSVALHAISPSSVKNSISILLNKPRLAVRRESWVGADFPAMYLLRQIGEIVAPEQITRGEWDIFVFIGNHPGRVWPTAFPYAKPLLILHRLSSERCDFPGTRNSVKLQLPDATQDIVHLLMEQAKKLT